MMIVSINYNIYQSDILPFVSAETFSCCEKTNDGAICQDVLSNYENCAADIVPTKCSSYSECQIGCCIDDEEGLCTTMSPRAKCEVDRGSGAVIKTAISWNAKRTAVPSEMKSSLSQKKDVNCFHLFLDLKKISEILEQNMNASHLKQIKLKGRVFLKMEFASLEQKVNAFVLEENFQKEICVQKKV